MEKEKPKVKVRGNEVLNPKVLHDLKPVDARSKKHRLADWLHTSVTARIFSGLGVGAFIGLVIASVAVYFDSQNRKLTQEALEVTQQALKDQKKIGALQILASDAAPPVKMEAIQYLVDVEKRLSRLTLVQDKNSYNYADYKSMNITSVEILDSDFGGVNLSSADFSDSQLEFVSFIDSQLIGGKFKEAHITNYK